MEDAFQRLDKLTPEEVLMAAAETMAVTRDIDDTVNGVDEKANRIEINTEKIEDKVEGVDSKVQNVDEGVKDVNKRVKDVNEGVKVVNNRVKVVDGRVGSVIQGRLFFPSMAPKSVLTLYCIRCKGGWNSDSTGI